MITRAKHWWKIVLNGDSKGILAGLAAHSGQISVGLSQGFSAVLVPKLLDSQFATVSETTWIASLGVISNPVGALLAGCTSEWFGRRSAIALATLPHAAGWLLIAMSSNVQMLYIGRFISGIGTGMANGIYLYVSEAAAPHQRPWLASSGPVLVSFGVLIIYILGALTTWQRTAAIGVGPAILSLALIRMLPETPAWLVSKSRPEEARESLLWLRGPGAAMESEYQELCECNMKRECQKSSLIDALHESCVWKPFLILLLFFTLQQFSGIYIILFYAVTVLTDIGVSVDEYFGSVGIGVVRLFTSIIGAALARNFGRKTMACISGLGMFVSAVGVALSIRYNIPSWIPLICIGSHVGFSMIGYLTLPWVMTSELYPLRFRGSLGGLTTSLAQLLTFSAIKTYPDLRSTIGLEATVWIFSCSSLLGAVFALTVLPETLGRSLEQIETAFSQETVHVDPESPSMIAAPKNVTLKRYASILEEKNLDNTPYVYDNYCFDSSTEGSTKKENCKTVSDKVSKSCLSLEHMYL
ncbi:facilitated trehalose transporter Tret1 [Orussus abietinus]|uniref:facilitated trehalose transporter Tret1 n=1 Tax=Orussus abietinus TaxID=222816 RepID=UPI0006251059|nr:facilitated trehalose transporter Tret1 [Orussus abietinus]XP_012277144.1 facilitated trehalose transporter Tret1 [Orussus abietinus]